MKLIIGLGNPGYDKTRHNVGFMLLDKYVAKNKIDGWKQKFDGLYQEICNKNEKVIFLKPQKFMNLSGEVVSTYMNYFKIEAKDILIVSDDLDINLGNYKLKDSGSSGGHNGLKNIEDHIKTQKYKRLKIGISNNKNIETKDYVLGKFSCEEQEKIDSVIETLIPILEEFSCNDFNTLMNKYNQKNKINM